jgi:hypothetical protein
MKPRWPTKVSPKISLPGCLGKLATSLVLLGSAGLVASSGWFSVQFMLDPRSLAWMNAYLPAGMKLPAAEKDPRQTLAQVKAALKKHGLAAGEPIFLSRVPDRSDHSYDLLMPVLRRQTECSENCDQIVELRVYRVTPSKEKSREYAKLVNQLATEGLEEFVVKEPLVLARAEEPGFNRVLPFTALQKLDDRAPAPGLWFNLSGQQPHSDSPITYGQILHYNPKSAHLGVMTNWTSPVGKSPVWQNVTGSKTVELVVNQTVGLEPDVKIYQLQPRKFKPNPIQLKAIALKKPALDDWAFDDALKLARSGLWAAAEKKLQDLKSDYGKTGWTAAAQAQLDLIAQHAQLSKTQADQRSADARQQVMVSLIDGRWNEATEVWRKSAIDRSDIIELLKVDSGRLWQRAATTLKLDPNQTGAKTWGALILAAKMDKQTALAWLNKQTPDGNQEIQTLLKQFDQTFANYQYGSPTNVSADVNPKPTPSPQKPKQPGAPPVQSPAPIAPSDPALEAVPAPPLEQAPAVPTAASENPGR